jgi:hypothetical protein
MHSPSGRWEKHWNNGKVAALFSARSILPSFSQTPLFLLLGLLLACLAWPRLCRFCLRRVRRGYEARLACWPSASASPPAA